MEERYVGGLDFANMEVGAPSRIRTYDLQLRQAVAPAKAAQHHVVLNSEAVTVQKSKTCDSKSCSRVACGSRAEHSPVRGTLFYCEFTSTPRRRSLSGGSRASG